MKLAMAQMLVEPGRKEANLGRAEERIAEASQRGADLVLLPEAMPLGWTDPSARTAADEIPHGDSCLRLCRAARRHGILVCAGLVERAGSKVFNAAVLIDRQGEIVLHHRKIHELDIARDIYSHGDRLGVVDSSLGPLGVMICADGFAPGQSISRTLALMGAKVILSPCAWAVPGDHDNVRDPYGKLWLDNYLPVASEFGISIVGVSNVGPITAGPWRGRKCIGNSIAVGADGRELMRGPYGESADELMLIEL